MSNYQPGTTNSPFTKKGTIKQRKDKFTLNTIHRSIKATFCIYFAKQNVLHVHNQNAHHRPAARSIRLYCLTNNNANITTRVNRTKFNLLDVDEINYVYFQQTYDGY